MYSIADARMILAIQEAADSNKRSGGLLREGFVADCQNAIFFIETLFEEQLISDVPENCRSRFRICCLNQLSSRHRSHRSSCRKNCPLPPRNLRNLSRPVPAGLSTDHPRRWRRSANLQHVRSTLQNLAECRVRLGSPARPNSIAPPIVHRWQFANQPAPGCAVVPRKPRQPSGSEVLVSISWLQLACCE